MLLSFSGCNNPTSYADGVCNDENNYEACFFDGGDCCGSNVNTTDCSECQCHCNISSDLIGDGICNIEANNAKCNFDGDDCCGHCQTIVITLQNRAIYYVGDYAGKYYSSFTINGRSSWTSASYAIWHSQDSWIVGDLHKIGGSEGHIISESMNLCPFNLPSERWDFFEIQRFGLQGTRSFNGANEVFIRCLDGNFF